MNKKLDIVIKLIISAAIIVTLIILALPLLESRGIISSEEFRTIDGPPDSGGTPAANMMKDKPPSGTEKPAGRPSGGVPTGERAISQAVKAYTASIGTVSNYIKVNGDIVTDVKINIYPDVSGKIIGMNTSVGDFVTRNQIVASIDPSLPGQKFAISSVYSTISGTVLSINARTGDKVTTSSSIITIGNLRDLKLITYIPEKFTGSLKTGLPAEVSFIAFPDETFQAEISEISPVIDPESRTMEVTLNISDITNRIKTGMFASIKLATEKAEGVVAVPSTAVFQYYGKDTVFIIGDDNKVEHRVVTLGLESSEMVEISDGLAAGEVVVTEGQSLLKDGSLVKIVE